MSEIFSVFRPQNMLPIIYDSPHSGTHYPEDFNYACDLHILRSAEDTYVDDLFAGASNHGAALLTAHFPRSYIDVNRAADDIDPNLLEHDWPGGNINPTSRSDAGIGLLRRLVKPGAPVYDRTLSPQEIQHRIKNYYHPYHNALAQLIDEAHYRYGKVWHINCHSMPASSATPKRAIGLVGYEGKPCDFVLGNRDGTSCDIGFTHALRNFLKKLGYVVGINDPFKGVELIKRYSNPARGRHSIQLEINKALYMNEETFEKNSNYDTLRRDIEKLMEFIATYTRAQLTDLAAD